MEVVHSHCAGLDVHKKTVTSALQSIDHGGLRDGHEIFQAPILLGVAKIELASVIVSATSRCWGHAPLKSRTRPLERTNGE